MNPSELIAPIPLLAPSDVPSAGSERAGLHSVIKRVCEKNQLTVNDVFASLILPQSGKPPDRLTKMNYQVHLINRGCLISHRLISQLHKLVNIPDLAAYTLQEFTELRGIGSIAVSRDRKWCPECFDSDLSAASGSYDRLLWCLDDVQICPIHKVQLSKICPSCGSGPFRVLTGRDISGHCPKCFCWLGGRSVILEESRDENTQFLFWQTRTYADILDHPLPSRLDAGQGINDSLRTLIKEHFDENYAALARAIERNKSVLCTWLKGNSLPSWRALIEISYVFQIPLPELLQGQYDGISISTIRRLPLTSITRLIHPRKLPQRKNVTDIRAFLKKVEVGELSSLDTLGKIAERLNIDARELRRILPVEAARLSTILANRRTHSRKRKLEGRERSLREEVPRAVLKILNTGMQPTRRAVHRTLSEVGISIMRREGPLIKEIVQNAINDLEKNSGIK